MPFGLSVDLAEAFFSFYQPRYDVVTWESRLILDSSEREVRPEDFAVINHVYDLMSVLYACRVSRAFLVGYCSGAGVGLAAANRFPQFFSSLILVHGEYTLLSDESCTTQFAADTDSLLSIAAKSDEDARQIFEDDSGTDEECGHSRGPRCRPLRAASRRFENPGNHLELLGWATTLTTTSSRCDEPVFRCDRFRAG